MPFYVDNFVGATTGLTAEEVGAYIRLLCAMWNTEDGGLDTARLARVAGVTEYRWGKIRPTIEHFLQINSLKTYQKRLTVEIVKADALIQQRSEAGKASARAKALKRLEAGPTPVDPPLQRDINENSTAPLPPRANKTPTYKS